MSRAASTTTPEGIVVQALVSEQLPALTSDVDNWRVVASALDELSHVDVNTIPKPAAVLQRLQPLLNSTTATLPGVTRLRLYRLLAAYSFAFWNAKETVDDSQKAEWREQISKLLRWVGAEEQTKDNVPYLHAYIYHLTCAAAAMQLMPDTDEIDAITHARNVLSIAGSYFNLCESKGSDVALAFFAWAKNRLSDRNTVKWYEKVGLLTAHQSQIMRDDTVTPKSKTVILTILRRFSKEYAKSVRANYQIIYACIEGLEQALLKITEIDPLWRLIIKGGVDPEDSSKTLIGLEKLADYEVSAVATAVGSAIGTVVGEQWYVLARFAELLINLQESKHNFSVTAWATISLNELTKKTDALKRTRDPIPKELLILDNRPEKWTNHLEMLKKHWPERKTEVQVSLSSIDTKLQQITAQLATMNSEDPNAVALKNELTELHLTQQAILEIVKDTEAMIRQLNVAVAQLAVTTDRVDATSTRTEKKLDGFIESQQQPKINIEAILLKLRDRYKTDAVSKIELYPAPAESPDPIKTPIKEAFVNLSIIPEVEQRQQEAPLIASQAASVISHEAFEDLGTAKTSIPLERIFTPDSNAQPLRKILVRGRAGIGKSTLCQYSAHRWATATKTATATEKADPFWLNYRGVFWIPLRNLNEDKFDKNAQWIDVINKECFNDNLSKADCDVLKAEITNNPHHFLFLLDGYDELPRTAKGNCYLETTFENLLSIACCLMTSRPEAAVGLDADCKLEVMGFISNDTQDDIQDYIRKFFRTRGETNDERAKKLRAYLKSQPAIWAIAHIPLQLSMMCQLAAENELNHGDDEKLTLSILYQRLIHSVFKRYLIRTKQAKETDPASELRNTYAPLQRIFEQLAFDLLLNNHIIFNEDSLIRAINICNPAIDSDLKKHSELKKRLFDECVNCGLLRQIHNKKNERYFIHLTFQEYFAGGFVASAFKAESIRPVLSFESEAFKSVQTILSHKAKCFDPKLQIMWLFAAGQLVGNTALLEKFFDRLKTFSARTFFTGERDNYERRLLLGCLNECGVAHLSIARDLFLGSLSNDVKEKKPAAVAAFGKLDLQSATVPMVCEKLETVLKRHSDPAVRCYAIDALEKLASPTTSAALCDKLFATAQEDPNEKVRLTAVEALGKLASDKAKEFFCEQLREIALRNPDAKTRSIATDTLVKLISFDNKKSFCDGLLKTALENANIDVQDHAIEALIKFAFFGIMYDISHSSFNIMLGGGILGGGGRLFNIVLESGNPVVVSILKKLSSASTYMKLALFEMLMSMLRNRDSNVRRTAIIVLGKLATPENKLAVCEKLMTMLGDKHWRVRISAMTALEKLATLEIKSENKLALCEMLMTVLGDQDHNVRRTAIIALEKLATPENKLAVCEKLIAMRGDKDIYVRQAANWVLEKLSPFEFSTAPIGLFAKPIANPPESSPYTNPTIARFNFARAIVAQYKKEMREAQMATHGTLFSAAPAARSGDDVIIDAYKEFINDLNEAKLSRVLSEIEPTEILKTIIENIMPQSAPAAAACSS